MAEEYPTAVKNQHGTTIPDGGRVVYRRMETIVKRAEFVLDLPDFGWYLGVSEMSRTQNILNLPKASIPATIITPLCTSEKIIESDFSENGIVGKITLSENETEYSLQYDVSVLNTDQVACSLFSCELKAFICNREKDPVLIASEKAIGRGNRDVNSKGSQMRIPHAKILEALLETNTTLRAVLNVKADIHKEPKPQCTVGTCGTGEKCDPPFLKPLQDGEGSDVELICNGAVFPVHGFILKIVSPVFRTMLEVPMMEAATRKIVIEDLAVDTVKKIVYYIYNGSIPVGSNAEVVELLYAAEKYELDKLKTACLERMITSMSDENVTSFLEISLRVNAGDEIIKQMVDYSMDRIGELRKREDFQAFARENSNLFVESWLSNSCN